MRRTVTYIVFGLCTLSLVLAMGGWMLRRSAFSPNRAADAAGDVLADRVIVDTIAVPVARVAATKLPQDASSLRAIIRLVAKHPQGHEYFADIIRDVENRILKRTTDTAHLTGEQLVPILRTQEAYNVPPVVIDVPRSRVLAFIDSILGWTIVVSAIAFPISLILMLLLRPDEGYLRYAALGLGITGLLVFSLAFLVPKLVIPGIGASPWLRVGGVVATNDLWLTLIVSVACLALGAFAFVRSVDNQRRRPRANPNYYRYTEERRWS